MLIFGIEYLVLILAQNIVLNIIFTKYKIKV